MQGKGSLLQHQKPIEFIARNYDGDAQGRRFFQNGPQRVYVELEATPLDLRVATDLSVARTVSRYTPAAWSMTPGTYIWRQTLGLVHTQDVLFASEAIESVLWELEQIAGSNSA